MREGFIGKQNSRIGKWKFENGKGEEPRGDQRADNSEQEALAL
jgi:hypothetical protein